jgi:NAD(P)H-hydrate epimerase
MERIVSIKPLPARPAEGHKGLFGRVLIVGGSAGMIGAPVLAGTAALRMGAGLVQIAVPRSILPHALSITPELIGIGLPEAPSHRDGLHRAAELADAIAVGPGMGLGREGLTRLLGLLRLDKPMAIDADALNLLSGRRSWPRQVGARAVLTPHPGEMRRLASLFGRDVVPDDEEGRIEIALAASRAFSQVVLLKGHRTVVADAGARVYVNRTGNSALSKAGSGDVLSGVLATLVAQGMDPFDAACAAAHLHGLAGEIAGARLGLRSVLARDVIDAIPQAIGRYEAHSG